MKTVRSKLMHAAGILFAVMLFAAMLTCSAHADGSSNANDAYEAIHQHVLALEDSFTVTSDSMLNEQTALANAIRYRGPSGAPYDGDALARIVSSINLGTPDINGNGEYVYHVTVTYVQRSKTIEEIIEDKPESADDFVEFEKEKELATRSAIADLVSELDIGAGSGKSDAEKMLAIYAWLESGGVRYFGFKGLEYPYDAIIDGKGNCAAIADIVYRLGLAAGVEVRITYKYRNGVDDYHYWNYVKINGKWYLFDALQGYDMPFFLTGADDSGDHNGYGFISGSIQELNFGINDSIPEEDFARSKYDLGNEGSGTAYAVVLNSNYPEGSGKSNERRTIAFTDTFTNVASASLDNIFRCEGYRISGWTPLEGGTVKNALYSLCYTAKDLVSRWRLSHPAESRPSQVILEFNASWTEAKDYRITYDANDGTGYMPPQYANEGDRVKVKTNAFKRPGYVFAYWSGSKDGSNGHVEEGFVINPFPARDYDFYAQWKSQTIRITFDWNDGNRNSSYIDVPYSKLEAGTKYYFPTLTRPGYKLVGWTNTATGETVTGKIFGWEEPENVTFKAVWNSGTYTVNFHPNGATNTGTYSQEIEIGKTTALKSCRFKRNEWTMAEWNTSADGSGTPYTDGQKVKDLTTQYGGVIDLYAIWRTTEYPITFIYGEGHGNSIYYKESGKNLTLTMPRMTDGNKTVVKWYPNTLSGMLGYDPGEKVTFSADIAVTLTAKWETGSYTISFAGNGATGGSTSAKTCMLGRTYALPANNFYRTGYRFLCWNTSPDGSGTSYTNKAEITDLCHSDGGTITLYAQWTPASYTVTVDKKNGEPVTTYEKINGENLVFVLPVPERHGYELQMFRCSADGLDYHPGYTITYTADRNATFTAQWTAAGRYNIVFSPNGGTGTQTGNWCYTGTSYSMADCTGFTPPSWKQEFKCWNTAPDGSGTSYYPGQTFKNLAGAGSTVTMYAQWKTRLIPYSVYFNANGGSGSMAKQTMYIDHSANISLNQFSRSGYRFNGWSTTASGGGNSYSNGQNVTNLVNTENGSITLYAKWVKTFTWRFIVDGQLQNSQTFDESTMATIGTASKSGRYFDYWTDSGGAKYYPGSRHKVASDKSFYANFTTDRYTLSFSANGGTGAPASITQNGSGYITLPAAKPTRSGYVFAGWSSSSSAASGQSSGTQYMLCRDTTLYACWKSEITISFSANGGSGAPASISGGLGDTVTIPYTRPTRSEHTFLGWATSPSATGGSIQPGSSYTLDSSKTLYAIYKVTTYTVSYSANGGVGTPAAQTRSGKGNITISSTRPTKTNYLFSYWADGSGNTYYPGGTIYVSEDIVLTAVWSYDPPTYTLSFSANGGSGAPSAITRKGPGIMDIPATVPVRTGYEFLGWSRTSNAASPGYYPGGQCNISGNTELYAIWKVRSYVVCKYYYGGSSSKMVNYGDYYSPGTPTQVPSGYSYAGWSTSSSPGSDGSYGSYLITGNKNLYAVFKKWVESYRKHTQSYTETTTVYSVAYGSGHYNVKVVSTATFYDVTYYTKRTTLSNGRYYYSGKCTKTNVTATDVAYIRQNNYNVTSSVNHTTTTYSYTYDKTWTEDLSYWAYYHY